KKSLKLTRLDDESGIGGGAMSHGKHSGIVGIAPPARFAQDVWDELVRQGKVVDGGHGGYEPRGGGGEGRRGAATSRRAASSGRPRSRRPRFRSPSRSGAGSRA